MGHAEVAPAVRQHRSLRERAGNAEQGVLILVLAAALIGVGAATTDGFLTVGNFSTVLQLTLGFGILAVGEATVVLAKGVDLSIAAVAAVSGLVTLELMQRGMSESSAILTMVVCALAMGALNGILVAYAGLPALFATLGTGSLYLGGVTVWLLDSNIYTVPAGSAIAGITESDVLGIPTYFLVGALVFVLAWVMWNYTTFGRMLRAMGDNAETARLDGQPDRPIQVAAYIWSSALGVLAGYILLSLTGSVLTTGSAFSPLLFTTLTVVVIGGISLSGGRGSILGLVAGTAFIGVMDNLLTLHSFSPASEDLTRGLVLMGAVVLDAWLHPRDDETSKSEDL
jgi:ribose transport system permease protein